MENKEKFIEELGKILMILSDEKVTKLKYIRENKTELVEIHYTNGYKKYVDITGDSCIAIMSDITEKALSHSAETHSNCQPTRTIRQQTARNESETG